MKLDKELRVSRTGTRGLLALGGKMGKKQKLQHRRQGRFLKQGLQQQNFSGKSVAAAFVAEADCGESRTGTCYLLLFLLFCFYFAAAVLQVATGQILMHPYNASAVSSSYYITMGCTWSCKTVMTKILISV